MATLPDFTAQGERPVPRPSGAVVGYRPQGSQAGEIMSGAGRELQQAAAYVAEGNLRQDTVAAESALNVLNAKAAELQYHTDSGFMTVNGGKALGEQFRDGYMGRLRDAAAEIGGTLQNDQQRALFKQRAPIAAMRFQSSLLQHQAQQTKVFNTQVDNDRITLSMTSIARDPKNEIGFTTQLGAMVDTIKGAGEREGWSPETIQAKQAAIYGAAYHARIVALLYGTPTVPADPDAAMDMYKSIAHNLDQKTIEDLAPKLQQVGMAAMAQTKGAQLAAQFPYTQTAEAQKAIDALPVGPAEKAQIRAEVEHRHAIQQSDQDKSQALMIGRVYEMMTTGRMSKAAIMASPEFSSVQNKGMILKAIDDKNYTDTLRANANDARAITLLQRKEQELHINGAEAAFAYSDPVVLNATPREKIAAQLPILGQQWTSHLLATKDAMERKEISLDDAKLDSDMIKGLANDFFKLDAANLKTKEQKTAFMDFKSRSERLVAAAQREAKRPLSGQEKSDLISKEAARTVNSGGIFGYMQNETPAIIYPTKDLKKVSIPEDAAKNIAEALAVKRAQDPKNPAYQDTPENRARWYIKTYVSNVGEFMGQ